MTDNLILLMIVSSIPLETKPRCVWEDTAITPIIRTSYNWITWWLEVRKQSIKTLVKAVCCSVSSTFYDMNLLKLFHGELFFSNWCYFLLYLFLGIVDLVDWAEKRDHMHSYPFLRVASVVASTCNASYWHLKAVSACRIYTFFLVSKVTCSLIYVTVS